MTLPDFLLTDTSQPGLGFRPPARQKGSKGSLCKTQPGGLRLCRLAGPLKRPSRIPRRRSKTQLLI